MKKVSVIIPCFNQGRYIEQTIRSVMESTYENIEVIIVNDGSNDQYTNNLLSNQKWEKTVIYFIANGGVSYARNFGIEKSTGDYILALDADDLISKNYISDAVMILDRMPQVKIVCCDVEMFGARTGRYLFPEYSIEMLLGQNTMVITSMFRRIDFDKTYGFNTNMDVGYEDWDFWLTLLTSGGEVFKLDYVGFYYRIKRKSRNNSIGSEQYGILRRKIYENHKELYSKYFLDPTKSFEYANIINSKEYIIGKVILKPIRKMWQLLNNCVRYIIENQVSRTKYQDAKYRNVKPSIKKSDPLNPLKGT